MFRMEVGLLLRRHDEPLVNTAPRRQGRPRKSAPQNNSQTAAKTVEPSQQQTMPQNRPQPQRQSQRLIDGQ